MPVRTISEVAVLKKSLTTQDKQKVFEAISRIKGVAAVSFNKARTRIAFEYPVSSIDTPENTAVHFGRLGISRFQKPVYR